MGVEWIFTVWMELPLFVCRLSGHWSNATKFPLISSVARNAQSRKSGFNDDMSDHVHPVCMASVVNL